MNNETIAQGTIRLQYVGLVSAIPAEALAVGMFLMWNGGALTRVERIRPAPGKNQAFLIIDELADSGKLYERKLKRERLVCGFWPKDKTRAYFEAALDKAQG